MLSSIIIKILSPIIKLFESLIGFFVPGKLKEIQIKVTRLDIKNTDDVNEFIDLYKITFPENGSNYTSDELIELFEDINNNNKHVKADNIILVAKYKDSIIGFIACFYYPEKEYGIIGYFGKSDQSKEYGKYVSSKILQKLKSILLKKHSCKLLVFELENDRQKGKSALFRFYAKNLGLTVKELKFDYYRPKMSLVDKDEPQLVLMVVPFLEEIPKKVTKDKILDILSFIHFYCYGDYYDKDQREFEQFQAYLGQRMECYETILPDEVLAE